MEAVERKSMSGGGRKRLTNKGKGLRKKAMNIDISKYCKSNNTYVTVVTKEQNSIKIASHGQYNRNDHKEQILIIENGTSREVKVLVDCDVYVSSTGKIAVRSTQEMENGQSEWSDVLDILEPHQPEKNEAQQQEALFVEKNATENKTDVDLAEIAANWYQFYL